ncbi:MAG: DUF3303 domain-containing protein [Alphaproteobacteria bacterium]|nr:DUF3303 domain-containing protein [Alphaproteobacteria bacterium]
MLFMVIETFRKHDAKAIYKHFREHGRGTPEGLTYVSSWIEASLGRCFQVMETDDVTLLQQWVTHWSHLVDFEVVPVATSAETKAAIDKVS